MALKRGSALRKTYSNRRGDTTTRAAERKFDTYLITVSEQLSILQLLLAEAAAGSVTGGEVPKEIGEVVFRPYFLDEARKTGRYGKRLLEQATKTWTDSVTEYRDGLVQTLPKPKFNLSEEGEKVARPQAKISSRKEIAGGGGEVAVIVGTDSALFAMVDRGVPPHTFEARVRRQVSITSKKRVIQFSSANYPIRYKSGRLKKVTQLVTEVKQEGAYPLRYYLGKVPKSRPGSLTPVTGNRTGTGEQRREQQSTTGIEARKISEEVQKKMTEDLNKRIPVAMKKSLDRWFSQQTIKYTPGGKNG